MKMLMMKMMKVAESWSAMSNCRLFKVGVLLVVLLQHARASGMNLESDDAEDLNNLPEVPPVPLHCADGAPKLSNSLCARLLRSARSAVTLPRLALVGLLATGSLSSQPESSPSHDGMRTNVKRTVPVTSREAAIEAAITEIEVRLGKQQELHKEVNDMYLELRRGDPKARKRFEEMKKEYGQLDDEINLFRYGPKWRQRGAPLASKPVRSSEDDLAPAQAPRATEDTTVRFSPTLSPADQREIMAANGYVDVDEDGADLVPLEDDRRR